MARDEPYSIWLFKPAPRGEQPKRKGVIGRDVGKRKKLLGCKQLHRRAFMQGEAVDIAFTDSHEIIVPVVLSAAQAAEVEVKAENPGKVIRRKFQFFPQFAGQRLCRIFSRPNAAPEAAPETGVENTRNIVAQLHQEPAGRRG